MRRRFFSVFLAVLLLSPPYIALADEILLDSTDGGLVAVEEIKEDTVDGGVMPQDEVPPETGGEDETTEPGNEDIGGIVLEDENPPYTGNGDIIPEQGNEGGGYSITSYNETTPVFIKNQAAFEEWVENQTIDSNTYGGSILLGDNITIKTSFLLSSPLSIDTGVYGVTLEGGHIYGSLSITGNGVDVPVLTVVNLGRFGSWESMLPFYNVTALGQDGKGGTAVHVQAANGSSPNIIEEQGHISSVGKGAVGVKFSNPINAYFLSVSVEGENSVAISAPDGSSMYYGKLKASGEGSRIVSGNNILLDTCNVSGYAPGAYILNRKIVALAGDWLYIPLVQYQDIGMSSASIYGNGTKVPFLLSGDETYPAEVRTLYAMWDKDTFNKVDTSDIKKTFVPGVLYDIYQGLGLEDGFSLDLTVDVLEGGKPHIISMSFGEDNDTGRRYVYFQTSDYGDADWFELEHGNFTLWRSDGEDESWYDFTDSPDIWLTDNGIIYYYDEITIPAWFCIQKKGEDEYSNIAVIYGYETKTSGSMGGDRIGPDRGGEDSVTTPAPAPKPTPEPEPTPESESAPGSASLSSPSASSYKRSNIAVQASAEIPSLPPSGVTVPEDEVPASDEEVPASDETRGSVLALPDEWENETTTAVSGKRLRMMMDAGERVTFIKNEIRMSFDASVLETLDIGDGQLFTVAVVRLDQLKYTVSAALDGTELHGLPCVATLDGNKYDISVSGTYDFTPLPEAIQPQTHTHSSALAVMQPSRGPDGEEKTNNLADTEEKPSASSSAIFALLGTGCVISTAVSLKSRVKKYGR